MTVAEPGAVIGRAMLGILTLDGVLSALAGALLLPLYLGPVPVPVSAVLSGLVKLQTAATGDGKRSAFIGVPDGEWFGEGSVLKGEARRYAVVALRDSCLMCLPRAAFDELQQHNLRFNQYLVQHLNMRLGQAMALIEAGRTRAPEHRVALYLSRLFWRSTRRLYLTQEELGSLVGLSRQTVNRVLRQLAARGIVSLELGRVVIVDDAALNRFLATSAQPEAG